MWSADEVKRAIDDSVSERLRELRRSKRLTQEQFASVTGVTKDTIVNLENRRQGATLVSLYLIAMAFDLKVAELLPTIDVVSKAKASRSPEDLLDEELPEWAHLVRSR